MMVPIKPRMRYASQWEWPRSRFSAGEKPNKRGGRDEHGDLHEVAEEHVRTAQEVGAQAREVEVVAVRTTEHRGDLETEDDEAPEDEEVHPAGTRLLHARHRGTNELLLAERVDDDRLEAFRNPVEQRCRGRGAQQVEPAPKLSEKEPERREEAEAEGDRGHHRGSA